jgi:chemotaxis protein methyltransferase CheR/type IV pilus assembly protein PilK
MTDSAGYAQACRKARSSAGLCLEMDDETFSEWTRLLQHRADLFIAPERRSFLVSGILARMRENNCQDAREYYQSLIGCSNSEMEWLLLVDRLTVHETCFFRHQSSMRLVAERLVPEVLEHGGRYTAWSVGCATGEEAYSLAMLIEDCMADRDDAPVWHVTGMDISRPTLERAREGTYLLRRLRDVPETFQRRYCRQVSASHFQIVDDLRERVEFSHLNLRDLDSVSMREVDLIYCQNLLIYYDRQRRIEIVDRLARFLRPGGVLVLAPGELLDWKNPDMEKVRYTDTLAYRRTDRLGAPAG